MRILFFLRGISYDRHFEGFLRAALARGHEISVALEVEKKGAANDPRMFEALRSEHAGFRWELAPAQDRRGNEFVAALRYTTDYLRYLDPRYADAEALRRRAQERAPETFVDLAAVPGFRSHAGRQRLDRILRLAERGFSPGQELREFILRKAPDVVAVSPLVGLGTPQGDYVRAAQELGIPTALLVASWDNLTNKGVIRDAPDLTLVWNPAQVEEAVELHGLARASVRPVGAHTYDHWFDWAPSRTREEFCAEVGLDPGRPVVLYTGSSAFVAPNEPVFVRRWIAGLRAAAEPAIRDAGVIVRPHPAALGPWHSGVLSDLENVVVWPEAGHMPNDVAAKSDYFDSLYHCAAVIGINTSALIEAAIVDRPVLSVLAQEYQHTQSGTLHFAHLRTENGGPVRIAPDLETHVSDLADALAGQDHTARNARFLRSFVRPLGLDRPAAPLAVDALEELAVTPIRPRRASLRARAARAVVWPSLSALNSLDAVRRSTDLGFEAKPSKSRRIEAPTRTRVLFVLEHPGILIHFDTTVEALAARGHEVHLSFVREVKHSEGLDALDRSSGRIVVAPAVPFRGDGFGLLARSVRGFMDYVRYLGPGLRAAHYSRSKWRRETPLPVGLRWLRRVPSLPAGVVKALLRTAAAIEDTIPASKAVANYINKTGADIVLVSPLVHQASMQVDVVKAARALGKPTALSVASWDNLTSKGTLRVIPDRVFLWNRTQRDEAVELHSVPNDRIVVTGAQNFDRWFDRLPRSSPPEFRQRLGLPPDQPYLYFVGSSRLSLGEEGELEYLRSWLTALRSTKGPLRDIPVLVRPHPRNGELWTDVDLSEFGAVTVWLRDFALPVLADDRADYYDAIHHSSAVVGINSSAMLESAIVGRPVYTILRPEVDDLQLKLVHFTYLLESNGGFLRESRSFTEHVERLEADLRASLSHAPQAGSFVESFVRPHGLDGPALPHLVAAIEDLATRPALQDQRPGAGSRPLRIFVRIAALITRVPVARHRVVGAQGHQLARVLRAYTKRAPDAPQTRALARLASRSEQTSAASRRWLKINGERLPKKWAFKDTKDEAGSSKAVKKAKPTKPTKAAKPPKPAREPKPPKAEKVTEAPKSPKIRESGP